VPVFFPKLLPTPGMSRPVPCIQRYQQNGYGLFLCPEAYIKDWDGSLPSSEVFEHQTHVFCLLSKKHKNTNHVFVSVLSQILTPSFYVVSPLSYPLHMKENIHKKSDAETPMSHATTKQYKIRGYHATY
jgi:hypothetical protein